MGYHKMNLAWPKWIKSYGTRALPNNAIDVQLNYMSHRRNGENRYVSQ